MSTDDPLRGRIADELLRLIVQGGVQIRYPATVTQQVPAPAYDRLADALMPLVTAHLARAVREALTAAADALDVAYQTAKTAGEDSYTEGYLDALDAAEQMLRARAKES